METLDGEVKRLISKALLIKIKLKALLAAEALFTFQVGKPTELNKKKYLQKILPFERQNLHFDFPIHILKINTIM